MRATARIVLVVCSVGVLACALGGIGVIAEVLDWWRARRWGDEARGSPMNATDGLILFVCLLSAFAVALWILAIWWPDP